MSVANRPVHRPLSPHLQIYRPQLTSMLSILHRATGIALAVGALYLAVWVMCAMNPRAYSHFQSFNTSLLGRFVLGGWLLETYRSQFSGVACSRGIAGFIAAIADRSRTNAGGAPVANGKQG